ncbi:DUF3592 domain-containing protein [Kitasatospora sp. NPDC101801]|uniref:DUF3592 domain-containing protein n=1 Tax=Kitasatospora sp. NPDC101801 TaxID=3364103 RepID=UPI00381CFACB
METPTAVAAGVVLTCFGGALLLWSAVELRLRHHLRRHGVPAIARVIADRDPYGESYGDTSGELDSAPLLSFPTEDGGAMLARPRGHTPLRRPARFRPGVTVPVAYDAERPGRVVLAAPDAASAVPGDVFWALLGTSALAGGLSLLGTVLAR